MKITIIGSTAYLPAMLEHKKAMEASGHEVFIPAFDSHPELNELGICEHNVELIRQADRIDCFYDGRSHGTVFDLGAVMALKKPLRLIHLNDKTLGNLFTQYSEGA